MRLNRRCQCGGQLEYLQKAWPDGKVTLITTGGVEKAIAARKPRKEITWTAGSENVVVSCPACWRELWLHRLDYTVAADGTIEELYCEGCDFMGAVKLSGWNLGEWPAAGSMVVNGVRR